MRFHFVLQLDRQSVSKPDCLANIYLIFLLGFLYFYFPTFCQPCSHTHLAYPSLSYALSIKFTEATQHIMMKSSPCVRRLFSHRARRFSSVSLDIFSELSALWNASEMPHGRLRNAHRDAREWLGTTKTAVYGGIDQSWKVSWAPHSLLGSTVSVPVAMPTAWSVSDI
jgi:hypothetical protein